MSPEEKIDRQSYWVLCKIYEQSLVTTYKETPTNHGSVYIVPPPQGIKVSFRLQKGGPETISQLQNLTYKLAEECVVKIITEGCDEIYPIWYCTFAPLGEKFHKLYKELDERFSEPPLKTIFHFRDGYLFRDGCEEHKKFIDMERTILEAAFEYSFLEVLDLNTEGLDRYTWEQIDDAIRRINNKIREDFGVNNFFFVDTKKHQFRRLIE